MECRNQMTHTIPGRTSNQWQKNPSRLFPTDVIQPLKSKNNLNAIQSYEITFNTFILKLQILNKMMTRFTIYEFCISEWSQSEQYAVQRRHTKAIVA